MIRTLRPEMSAAVTECIALPRGSKIAACRSAISSGTGHRLSAGIER